MAHLVKDLDNLNIHFTYLNGQRMAFLMVWNADMTEVEAKLRLPIKVAEVLAEHGMSSGS